MENKKPTDIEFSELVRRYREGIADADELAALGEYCSLGGEWRDRFELELKSLQNGRMMDSYEQRAFFSVTERIEEKRRIARIRRHRREAFAMSFAAAAIAAVIIISRPDKPSAEPVRYTTVEAVDGNPAGVMLADGSRIRLTPGSKIRYGSDFSAENRKVELDGEGYFDIVSDREHPFEIAAQDCKVQVLGTKFNLAAHPGGDEVRLTLVKGSVAFTDPEGGEMMITPGQCVTWSRELEEASLADIDLELFRQWMDGDVEFKDMTIRQIAGALTDLYGKTVEVSPDLKSSRAVYTMRLVNRESLDEVADAMEDMLPVRFRRSATKLIIENR